MNLKEIVISWDFAIAIILTIFSLTFMPERISNDAALKIYEVCVSTLALIFSIYFASMAFILFSSDDDFVVFLEKKGHFTFFIDSYKYTLIVVFAALMLSLFFLLLNVFVNKDILAPVNSKWVASIIIGIGSYSLFCVINTTLDSINFIQRRIKFIRLK